MADIVFPDNVLASITPTEITRWFKLKAYGDPDADEEAADTKPTGGRCSSLEFYKKALSSFMPNKHLGYDVITERGNPTKSPAVNDLIKIIRREEVRGEGAPSKARRGLDIQEF